MYVTYLATSNKVSEKADKKQLVTDAMTKIFPLNPSEIESLQQQIQYMYNNNLIKRSKIIKRVFKKFKKLCSQIIS